MAENKFPLERILNVTATEYCSNAGKELRNYELRGVHVDDDLPYGDRLISRFQEKVPPDAEVVVSFSYALSGGMAGGAMLGFSKFLNQYASGTALIPKKE